MKASKPTEESLRHKTDALKDIESTSDCSESNQGTDIKTRQSKTRYVRGCGPARRLFKEVSSRGNGQNDDLQDPGALLSGDIPDVHAFSPRNLGIGEVVVPGAYRIGLGIVPEGDDEDIETSSSNRLDDDNSSNQNQTCALQVPFQTYLVEQAYLVEDNHTNLRNLRNQCPLVIAQVLQVETTPITSSSFELGKKILNASIILVFGASILVVFLFFMSHN